MGSADAGRTNLGCAIKRAQKGGAGIKKVLGGKISLFRCWDHCPPATGCTFLPWGCSTGLGGGGSAPTLLSPKICLHRHQLLFPVGHLLPWWQGSHHTELLLRGGQTLPGEGDSAGAAQAILPRAPQVPSPPRWLVAGARCRSIIKEPFPSGGSLLVSTERRDYLADFFFFHPANFSPLYNISFQYNPVSLAH